MSEKQALVSVIIPFYNTLHHFMVEAIESVIQQTYPFWEILLIDDGSKSESVALALQYSQKYPTKIQTLHHPDHQNLGISASRQLGIRNAQGENIAFLDADDIWLPNKLAEQVALLEQYPEVSMVYGNTLYWYSWTREETDLQRDFMPRMGIGPNTVIEPPKLLPLFLLGKAAVPCICSLLIRRQTVETIGGFEPSFTGLYEDQVLYAKICLETPVFVAGQCWDRYRQHPKSISAVSRDVKQASRTVYLKWLEGYLSGKNIRDLEVWLALRRATWYNRESASSSISESWKQMIARSKKWLLKFEEEILPLRFRRWIWVRDIKQDG